MPVTNSKLTQSWEKDIIRANSKSEGQETRDPVKDKSQVCQYFLQGTCKFGDKCRHSHDVPTAETVDKQQIEKANSHSPKTKGKPSFTSWAGLLKGEKLDLGKLDRTPIGEQEFGTPVSSLPYRTPPHSPQDTPQLKSLDNTERHVSREPSPERVSHEQHKERKRLEEERAEMFKFVEQHGIRVFRKEETSDASEIQRPCGSQGTTTPTTAEPNDPSTNNDSDGQYADHIPQSWRDRASGRLQQDSKDDDCFPAYDAKAKKTKSKTKKSKVESQKGAKGTGKVEYRRTQSAQNEMLCQDKQASGHAMESRPSVIANRVMAPLANQVEEIQQSSETLDADAQSPVQESMNKSGEVVNVNGISMIAFPVPGTELHTMQPMQGWTPAFFPQMSMQPQVMASYPYSPYTTEAFNGSQATIPYSSTCGSFSQHASRAFSSPQPMTPNLDDEDQSESTKGSPESISLPVDDITTLIKTLTQETTKCIKDMREEVLTLKTHIVKMQFAYRQDMSEMKSELQQAEKKAQLWRQNFSALLHDLSRNHPESRQGSEYGDASWDRSHCQQVSTSVHSASSQPLERYNSWQPEPPRGPPPMSSTGTWDVESLGTETMSMWNDQRILVLGDGNLSFSLALAKHRKDMGLSNVGFYATTFDTRETFLKRYGKNIPNQLQEMGVVVRHGVDARALEQCNFPKFHVVVWNFPHAGAVKGFEDHHRLVKWRHINLMREFFHCVHSVLEQDGLVKIAHNDRAGGCNKKEFLKASKQSGFNIVKEHAFGDWGLKGYQRVYGDYRDERPGVLRDGVYYEQKRGNDRVFVFKLDPSGTVSDLELMAPPTFPEAMKHCVCCSCGLVAPKEYRPDLSDWHFGDSGVDQEILGEGKETMIRELLKKLQPLSKRKPEPEY